MNTPRRPALWALAAIMFLSACEGRAWNLKTSRDRRAIALTAGPHKFIWTFSQPVQAGQFVDGQPWVLWRSGLKLVDVSPAGHQADNVNNYSSGDWIDGVWVDMTVRNPVPVTTIEKTAGKLHYHDAAVYGYDSRKLTRSRTEADFFDLGRAWRPTKSPLRLMAGDSIVTVKSYGPGEEISNTPLKAAAVLSVVKMRPPKNAFRPAVIRTAVARRRNQYYTTDHIISLKGTAPHMLRKPKRNLYDLSYSPTEYDWADWSEDALSRLLTGPELVSVGQIMHEASHAAYNLDTDNHNTYGGDMARLWGRMAIGALAGWLKEGTRRDCAIKVIQQAIDVRGAVEAGLTLSHDGGMNPAYGALLTVAGGLLGRHGEWFLGVNDKVNGLTPDYYFADYAQCLVVAKKTAKKGAIQHVDYRDERIELNFSTRNGTLAAPEYVGTEPGACFLRFPKSFKWKRPRPQLTLPQCMLKINSGPGASDQLYMVAALKNRFNSYGSEDTYAGTSEVYGGDLFVVPDWPAGNPPGPKSRITISAVSDRDLGRIVFNAEGWGGAQYSELIRDTGHWQISPQADYAPINAAAYMGLSIAIHALDLQERYTSLFDDWLIQESQIPGAGEVLFNASRSAYMTGLGATTDNPRRKGQFLGALFRQEMLVPNGYDAIQYNPDTPTPSVTDYQAPERGVLWNKK